MEIRSGSVSFPALRGGGPRHGVGIVVFPRDVLHATAGVIGFSSGFSGGDHHVGNMDFQVDTVVQGATVEVTVTYGLRDWSDNWDDDYEGTLDFVVLAELESLTAPPTRKDLSVVDVEWNQATQFFRSSRHLDPQTAMPDNSVRLIGGKNTGVRVYLDFDAASPSPPARLSGELRVMTSSGATHSFRPLSQILPIAEVAIDRGRLQDTLNFMIPGIWCHDTLNIEIEAFDPTNPTARSGTYQRSIRFVEVAPLQVHCVGIHYTGQNLNAAAPDLSACAATLDWTERVYPVGDVQLVGYSTMDYSEDMKPEGDDCGDGFGGILDQLLDARGSGDELYLGLLPSGAGIDTQIDTKGWWVTGCERDGVGASFAADGRSSAHELGHALGRSHAPCDSDGRCDDPQDQDDSYPKYGIYVSDSIGEYGYDPIGNQLFDPAQCFDFMGYSSNSWVSPYTYAGLMGRLVASDGIGGGGGGAAQPMKQRLRSRSLGMALNLRFTIERAGAVVIEPSFSYEVKRIPLYCCKGQGRVGLHDDTGSLIECAPFRLCTRCCCGNSKKVRRTLSLPPQATKLIIRRGADVLLDTPLGAPPEVEAQLVMKESGMEVRWRAREEACCALVQGLGPDGLWRGLAARTTDHVIVLDRPQIERRRYSKLRLLVVKALATAVIDLDWTLKTADAGLAQIVIQQVAPGVLKGWVIGHDGHEQATLSWTDEHGYEIGRGHTLDLRGLSSMAVVRAIPLQASRRIRSVAISLSPGPHGHLAVSRIQTVTPPVRHRPDSPHGTPPHQH